MKKQIGKLLGRWKSAQRRRAERLRKLQLESLEGRRLLAADFSLTHHNYLIAEDVNQDFRITPLDALLTINELNRTGSRALDASGEGTGEDQSPTYFDVNGDNLLSPMDALTVINRLNAEGEEGVLLNYSYEITDTSGAPITSANVGQTFRVNVFVQDARDAADATGVFSVAHDLGLTNTDLVTFQQPTSFFSGVNFSDDFENDRGASQGGGIQVTGTIQPNVSDGQTFSITTGSGSVTFEFDWNGSVGAGNTPVTLRDPSASNPPDPLSFNEVVNPMVTAIQGAGLGLTPTNNGAGVVGLPLADITVDLGTSNLALSQIDQEFFNEVKAFNTRTSFPADPTLVLPFYSVDFLATAPGTVTFTPNAPERAGSENTLFGSAAVLPNEMIMFGTPFSVTINADPTGPVAVNDTVSTLEDNSLLLVGGAVDLTTNDTREPGRTLSVVSISPIQGTTVGSLNGFTYTPPANFNGSDTVTYLVQDSTGLQATGTVTINVTADNDPPVATDDAFSVDENTTNNPLNVLANDNGGPNEPTDTLTVSAVGTPSNGGNVTIVGGGSSLEYTPATGFVGTETFTYTLSDQGGLTDTATVTMTVVPGVLPSGLLDTAQGAENTSITIDVLANDRVNPNSSALLLSFTDGANGTVTRNDGGTPSDQSDDTLVYTPNDPDFIGTDSFTYVMNDTSGLGENSTGTVSITVTDVNDPPVLADDTANATEDTAATIAISSLLQNDSPGAGEAGQQTLTVTSVAAVGAGGSVAISGDNIVYTPADDFNGTFLFTYTAQDNGTTPSALSGTATVTVTVAAVNDNPIAGANTASGTEDTALSIPVSTLLSNDTPGPATATDEAGQTLSITGVSSTSNAGGTVSLSGPSVNYTPAADFNGSDSFTYTLSDGVGGTATGTVVVNVAPINDAPIAGTDSATAFKDNPATIQVATLLSNDSAGPANESGQTLQIVGVSATSSTNGQVVLNGDGTITYTPDANFTGVASFEYQLQDNGASGGQNVNSATGTVNVTVEEFVPTTISGTVFIDETRDGAIDADELRLGGVSVTISGTSLGQAIQPQTQTTLSDGSYSFGDLGPGQYVVSYTTPALMIDGLDIAGTLGDADTVENQFTINVAQPGGFAATGYNFAVAGVEAYYGRLIEQLASSHTPAYEGAFFAVGADNSLLWGTILDGFSDVVFAEAVLSSDSRQLLLTVVDSSQGVFTATLGRGEFLTVHGTNGYSLIRVLGGSSQFSWQQVNRGTPPVVSANRYLDAVDAIFAQEGWN